MMTSNIELEKNRKILHLKEYFISMGSIEDLLKTSSALEAINLLKKIQEEIGEEYAFFHIQEGSMSSYCIPCPISLRIKNPKITRLYGIYGLSYFEDFLKTTEAKQAEKNN